MSFFGNLFGGSPSDNQVVKTTNETKAYTPNPQTAQYASFLTGQAQNLPGPGGVPLQGVAGWDPYQTSAYSMFPGALGAAAPWWAAGKNYVDLSTQRPDTEQFLNPYGDYAYKNWKQYVADPYMRDKNASDVAAAGGVGADRLALARTNEVNDLSNQFGGLMQQQWNTAAAQAAAQRQAQAAAGAMEFGAAPSVQATGFNDVNALFGMGAQGQNLQQQIYNALYGQRMQQYQNPYQNLALQSGLLSPLGGALGGTQTGTGTQTTQYPAPSIMSMLPGLAMTGMGLFGSGGMFPGAIPGISNYLFPPQQQQQPQQNRGGRVGYQAGGSPTFEDRWEPVNNPGVYFDSVGSNAPPGVFEDTGEKPISEETVSVVPPMDPGEGSESKYPTMDPLSLEPKLGRPPVAPSPSPNAANNPFGMNQPLQAGLAAFQKATQPAWKRFPQEKDFSLNLASPHPGGPPMAMGGVPPIGAQGHGIPFGGVPPGLGAAPPGFGGPMPANAAASAPMGLPTPTGMPPTSMPSMGGMFGRPPGSMGTPLEGHPSGGMSPFTMSPGNFGGVGMGGGYAEGGATGDEEDPTDDPMTAMAEDTDTSGPSPFGRGIPPPPNYMKAAAQPMNPWLVGGLTSLASYGDRDERGLVKGSSPFGQALRTGAVGGLGALQYMERQRKAEMEAMKDADQALQWRAPYSNLTAAQKQPYESMTAAERGRQAIEKEKIDRDRYHPPTISPFADWAIALPKNPNVDKPVYMPLTPDGPDPSRATTTPPAPTAPPAQTSVAPAGGRLVTDNPTEMLTQPEDVGSYAKRDPKIAGEYFDPKTRGPGRTAAEQAEKQVSKEAESASILDVRAKNIRHNLDVITNWVRENKEKSPAVAKLLEPGITGDERAKVLQYAKYAGIAVPDNVLAAVIAMGKDSTLGGFKNITAEGLSAREAQPIIRAAMGAMPSFNLPEQASRVLLASMESAAQRQKDRLSFLTAYRRANGGYAAGWEDAFNKQFPPEKYVAQAIYSVLPEDKKRELPEATQQLRAARDALIAAEQSGDKAAADAARKKYQAGKAYVDKNYGGLGDYLAFGRM